MQIEITRSTVTLARDGLLAVRDGAGTRIVCRSGNLWITQEGDLKDAIIGPADAFTIRKSGLTIVTALQSSSLTLIGPDAQDRSEARRALGLDTESIACS
ncbi:MAG: DUF2917 domain-containing protein [Betaproteobacteria bacterium]|nr:DUF2917 domain-containing protein [Betaproteobacteria bacterium]